MSAKNESWGRASVVQKHGAVVVHAKASDSGWSMEKLTPHETHKTQSNKYSYSGMTVIRRNGSK